MGERKTRGAHVSADIQVSELPVPEVLFRPGAGMPRSAPQDAAPRVPNLPCPKCGTPDTTMRFCDGGYSLSWGMCMGDAGEHFHRDCPRCKHRWSTHDVLGAQ